MADVFDYIEKYKDIRMKEMPLGEVDAMILCLLSYMDYGALNPENIPGDSPIAMRQMYFFKERSRLFENYWYEDNQLALFEAAARSERLGLMQYVHFEEVIDEEVEEQFAAYTAILPDELPVVVFRGTDVNFVGWKEDMNMNLAKKLPSQQRSVDYLERMVAEYGDVIITGHSKGGHLAAYSAMFCNEETRKHIAHVYNFDGPGFRKEILAESNYELVEDKIQKLIPRESFFGILLEGSDSYEVVEAKKHGTRQHTGFRWEVEDDHFKRSENRSAASIAIDKSVNAWMQSLSQEEAEFVGEKIYALMQSTGAENLLFKDMGIKDAQEVVKSVLESEKEVDEESKERFREIMGRLVETTKSNFKDMIGQEFKKEQKTTQKIIDEVKAKAPKIYVDKRK